jgi:hypothetical protein
MPDQEKLTPEEKQAVKDAKEASHEKEVEAKAAIKKAEEEQKEAAQAAEEAYKKDTEEIETLQKSCAASLKEYKGESNIPLNENYWTNSNRLRSLLNKRGV